MSEVENAPLTQEQKLKHVKNNLNKTLIQFHNNLFNFVGELPLNEDQKKFALANLIQALHWVEDGIEALHFEVEDLPTAPPVDGENSNATQEGNKQESNPEEHQDGNKGREEAVTSSSDCLQECGQEQKQEEVTPINITEGA